MEVFYGYVLVSVTSNTLSATVAKWVTHSLRNTEDVGLIPGTDKYIVARMAT